MAKPIAPTGIPEVAHMLLMVFRSSLERDVLALLRDLRVKAFTDLPEVLGAGEAGVAFHSFPWPGFNSMILIALDEHESLRIVNAMRAFRDRMGRVQHGASIPLRVFVVPCVQAI